MLREIWNRTGKNLNKILIIQTAFLGDVILATSLVEQLHARWPGCRLDFLLRKGNESLLQDHPKINEVLIWDKKQGKYSHLFSLLKKIRRKKYDAVINVHRFASSGMLTAFSGAGKKIGFHKNPFSFLFTDAVKHEMDGRHEVERNSELVTPLFQVEKKLIRPKLYPSKKDSDSVPKGKYICMAPCSVWMTKQLPIHKWVELCNNIPEEINIYLLGAKNEKETCEIILKKSRHPKIKNKAGELNLLQSAAWMQMAQMSYVNDSAPLHLASSVNAPCTAFFCSTVPRFGFYPLSEHSIILENNSGLKCRPCGLHGKKSCPEGHFKCGEIDLKTADPKKRIGGKR